METAEPRILFTPSTDPHTSAQVQVMGYKPLPGEALLPTRKLSSQTTTSISERDFETRSNRINSSVSAGPQKLESIYGNDEVLRESCTGTLKNEDVSCEQSKDSLYVKPDSWLLTDSNGQGEDRPPSSSEEIDEAGTSSRNRVDSQKYLLPAELVLHMPKDMRKMSGGSLSGDVSNRSPLGNGLQIKWKAHAPIIHNADEPNRKSSIYVCMDSGSLPTTPIKYEDSTTVSKENSFTPTSFSSLPPPCRKFDDNPGYINVRPDSKGLDASSPSFTEASIYEPVSSLVSPSIYGNANEIFRSKLSPPVTVDDRNEPDTYNLCFFPESEAAQNLNTRNNNVTSEEDVTGNNDDQSDGVTTDPNITSNNEDSNQALSYVNVAQFHKKPSENKMSSMTTQADVDRYVSPVKEKVPVGKAETISEVKSGNAKKYGQSKPPPVSKKPKMLTKPKASNHGLNENSSSANSLNGRKRTMGSSLKLKFKNRLSKRTSNSPDLPSGTDKELHSTEVPCVTRSSSHRNSKSIKSQIGDSKFPISEPSEDQNLLPSTSAQATEVEDPVKAIEDNSNVSRQIADTKERNSPSNKRKQLLGVKWHNRKSGSGFRGKLDLSEVRSKLKKTY